MHVQIYICTILLLFFNQARSSAISRGKELYGKHSRFVFLKNGINVEKYCFSESVQLEERKKLGYKQSDFPESLACYDTLLRLPIHTKLTRQQVCEISEIMIKGIRFYG